MYKISKIHIKPHSLTKEEILNEFKVDPNIGLIENEIILRRKTYGENILPQEAPPGILTIFLHQLRSLMVLILVSASLLSWFMGHSLDAIVIVTLILVNVAIGFFQEFQAEKAIQSLKKLVETKSRVRRDGKIIYIPPNQLVPGDILILKSGDKVTADSRVIINQNLRTMEASLTGDSHPIDKDTNPTNPDALISDRQNMVFMGTLIISGEGEAVVVFTGEQTQLGQIAKSVEEIKDTSSHYEKKTNQLSKFMGIVAISSAAVTFLVGYFIRQFGLYEMVSFTTATLISALPEGLPIILIIVLAIGAQRMAKKKAIVRKLAATETLGVVSVIITDKTGTITKNQMCVRQLALPGLDPFKVENSLNTIIKDNRIDLISHITSFCHSVNENEKGYPEGDPTEVAVYLFANKIKTHNNKVSAAKKILDLPFVQELRLRASVLSIEDSKNMLCVIGAPESVEERCSHFLGKDGKPYTLNPDEKSKLSLQFENMTSKGMRVLAIAYKYAPKKLKSINPAHLNDLTHVGYLGLIDPPRPEVKKAIFTAHDAGIKVIMATGDHPLTAKAVAVDIGLIKEGEHNPVLSEKDISLMNDKELLDALRTAVVFARLTPASKLRIASLLQNSGEIVAMTGDGVNDASALKQADVGISMGVVGTDVAREASDIVLADDNFASIVDAVREGRTQFGNIRRTSSFLIITNVAESAAILITLFFGYPLPLLPLQILWLNIITGGVTDFALATEPSHDDVMKVAPRNPNEKILTSRLLPLFLTIVFAMITLVIGAFIYYLPEGIEKARTAVFVVFSVTQLFNMFNLRVLHRPVISIGLFTNKVVNIVFIISLSLGLAVLYIPFLRNVFGFSSLKISEISILALLSFVVFIVAEVVKRFFPAGSIYKKGRMAL